MRTFATKQEVAAVLAELRAFRGDFDTFRAEAAELGEQLLDMLYELEDGETEG